MTSSLGEDIISLFASNGYNIIGLYHKKDSEAKEFKKEIIKKYKVNMDIYRCDLSNEIDINNLYEKLKDKKINVLVNNASISLDNEFLNKTKQEFMKVLEVNLVGTFLLIKYLSRLMDNGYIFNIASTDGLDTYSDINIDYAASKAGLINLSKSLSLVLDNINIYSISPNWIDTTTIKSMNSDFLTKEMERIGQSRLLKPREVSNVIYGLINNDIKSGTNFRIDVKDNEVVVKNCNE